MCMYLTKEHQTSWGKNQQELQGEIHEFTITVENTLLYQKWTASALRKSEKDIAEPNTTINHMDRTDIYIALYPTTEEYTFFSRSLGVFIKRAYIVNHQTHFNKFKRR